MSDYIYGRNPVLEWLHGPLRVKKLYVLRGISDHFLQEINAAALKKSIPISRLDRHELGRLAGTENHQGVVAQIELPVDATMDDILQKAKEKDEPPLLAALDCVQDPHNLGAILRSADGAGVHGVVIPRDKAAQITPAVVKSSAGAAVHMPIARVTNLARTIDELKEAGLWFVGTDHEAPRRFDQVDLKGPIGIVLGGEGKGLRRLVRERCDFLVKIPMAGRINSLNVSVAAALLFFEARRQRGW
ncbi:23S rRNA (guanosine(2251)-2'-O)-methyltransferase RlmB [candidate division KSB1 bacterium]|nr:23S rRNA (guanosine(2251)-2'-O)-methyltransferase RlmB [candidate division KSB1 bacterium]